MDIRRLSTGLALVVAAAAAQANSAAADAPKAAAAASAPATTAAADADRKICKTERPMGSLIPARVCKTAAQWDQEREQSRKMMQDLQQRTGSTSGR